MRQGSLLTEVKHQPFLKVFQAELEEVQQRRKQCLPQEQWLKEGDEAPGKPSTQLNLVGLALSGGGIRSASFSLGVVQELARRNLLKHVDYLSTVSGGGYLGACLSSVLLESTAESLGPQQFPLRKQAGEPEPPVLSHLRNGSNYLKPPGLLNAMSLAVVLLRGFILTFVALLPLIYLAVFLTALIYEVVGPELMFTTGIHLRTLAEPFPAAVMGGAFLTLAVLFPFAMVLLRPWMNWRNRGRYQTAMAATLLFATALTLLWPVLSLVNVAAYMPPGDLAPYLWARVPEALRDERTWAAVAVGAVALAFFPWGRKVLKPLGIALAALMGPVVLFATYLTLCLWQVSPPRKFELTDAGVELFNRDASALVTQVFELEPHSLIDDGAVELNSPLFARRQELAHSDEHLFWDTRHVILDGQHFYIANEGRTLLVRGALMDPDGTLLLLLAGGILLVNFRFLNINYTSPHSFYRDQLSRVFLVKEKGGEVEPNDTLKLSELRRPPGGGESCAPYHLINATINLGSDTLRDVRGRKGGFFLFSQRYVGSEETGWCETPQLEKVSDHLNLGTAMAISGAAAAPNMGAFTMRAFSFLMMLLNVRLGFWLPNPAKAVSGRPFWGPGPKYLLKEALGLFGTQGRYVNVSDGGHLENLGVYELLRRRCKLIISVDGEADPRLGFNSLVTLLRFARIDMGISIDIKLDELRRAEHSSKAHWAVGHIDYGGGERGTLLYLKSTLTGDESPYVRAYHEGQPAFPHESTANQFFTETQLEVYRALGEHIADNEALRQEVARALGLAAVHTAQESQPAVQTSTVAA
ncbi:MAG TPA: patatin-like phospholipase family protein [Myxococcaceae bacterium]|jgi:hypothetical protein